jgi:hypothetical protein
MTRLTNPDIYLADIGGGVRAVRRMWDAGTLSIKPMIRRSARGASIFLMCNFLDFLVLNSGMMRLAIA